LNHPQHLHHVKNFRCQKFSEKPCTPSASIYPSVLCLCVRLILAVRSRCLVDINQLHPKQGHDIENSVTRSPARRMPDSVASPSGQGLHPHGFVRYDKILQPVEFLALTDPPSPNPMPGYTGEFAPQLHGDPPGYVHRRANPDAAATHSAPIHSCLSLASSISVPTPDRASALSSASLPVSFIFCRTSAPEVIRCFLLSSPRGRFCATRNSCSRSSFQRLSKRAGSRVPAASAACTAHPAHLRGGNCRAAYVPRCRPHRECSANTSGASHSEFVAPGYDHHRSRGA